MGRAALSSVRRIVAFVAVVGCGVFSAWGCQGPSTGWGLTELPRTEPGEKELLDAAWDVIHEQYPQSAVSRKGQFIVALTPVSMDAANKSRKQVSVYLLRNFTGAYEPVVRVRQFIESGHPLGGTNPESGNAVWNSPIASNDWQALDYLPYEEQQIYDDILARLRTNTEGEAKEL